MFKKQPGVCARAFVEIVQLDLKYQTLKLLLTSGLSHFWICTYEQLKKKGSEGDWLFPLQYFTTDQLFFLPDLTAIQMHWFCCTLN